MLVRKACLWHHRTGKRNCGNPGGVAQMWRREGSPVGSWNLSMGNWILKTPWHNRSPANPEVAQSGMYPLTVEMEGE